MDIDDRFVGGLNPRCRLQTEELGQRQPAQRHGSSRKKVPSSDAVTMAVGFAEDPEHEALPRAVYVRRVGRVGSATVAPGKADQHFPAQQHYPLRRRRFPGETLRLHLLGWYALSLPELVQQGECRPLKNRDGLLGTRRVVALRAFSVLFSQQALLLG